MSEFSGLRALVTGGARGIGLRVIHAKKAKQATLVRAPPACLLTPLQLSSGS